MMALKFYKNSMDEVEFKLPETHEEWIDLREYLIANHNLEDIPETWTFVLGQIISTKMPSLYTTIESIVNHYRRWKIATLVQAEKAVYNEYFLAKQLEMYKKQEEANKAQGVVDEGVSPSEHTEHVQSGAHYSEGDLPPLPIIETRVEPDPSQRRF